MKYGDMVRKARKGNKDTLRIAGNKLGIRYTTLSDIERGRRLPSENLALAIQKTYGVAIWQADNVVQKITYRFKTDVLNRRCADE